MLQFSPRKFFYHINQANSGINKDMNKMLTYFHIIYVKVLI